MAKTNVVRDLETRIEKAKKAVEAKYGTIEGMPPASEDIQVEGGSITALDTAEVPAEIAAPAEVVAEAPAPAEPPAEAPKAEAPKAETPVEVKAEPPAEEPKPDVERYRAERESRRQIRRLEKEIAALQAKQTQAPVVQASEQPVVPETTDNDPFGFEAAQRRTIAEVNAKLEENNRKLEEQRQLLAQEQARLELSRQEAEFAAKHPDYNQARDHLMNWERERVLKSGLAKLYGQQLRQAAESRDDPQARAYVDRVEAYADEKGITDDEAWAHAGADTWVETRRQEFVQLSRATGQSVAQTAWDMSTQFAGYKPQETVTGAPTAAKIPEVVDSGPPVSPAERIRQQARAAAAGKSLSAVSASAPPQTEPAVRTLQQWQAWRQRDPQAATQWLRDNAARDPNFHNKLGNG